ncbi:efflux transporter outer membrane subunit [Flavihumibacter profundi]|jgi:outer membrane protein, multidrug efflux system|uniref:efflux transporter outer membrane subunit n=1 Tax=Flavihumibacter profundi TaxID=2716883 RepID=UPI001CC44D99|nr:efflux transporter outer membrane subunit [Flavihumibacter profundi]MBZ5858220.1 efflux transporter outer membrane subunit [Flavihumibacter profundi]
MKHNRIIILLLILALGWTACMVGPKYSRPNTDVAIDYREKPGTDTSALVAWFDLYKDTVLQHYIQRVLDSNRNLMTAAARIEEARAISGVVKANLYPKFDYQLSGGGGSAGTEAQKVSGGYDGGVLNAFGVLSWEIDIWGKVRHANRAAIAEMLSAEDSRNALKVSLVAETATLYFLLRDLDNRLEIAKRTLESRKENTRILTNRFDTGYVSELDKLQAINQQAAAAALIPNIQRQIVQTENALRVMMGMGPGQLNRGLSNYDQAITPDIPVGLPSQLLVRRPDIRSAENSLQAQFERIGVAEANRFPSFSLTGLLGFASPQLSTFLGTQGLVANGFANLAGPIFNFGQNKRLVEVQRKRTEQLIYQYQQTVLGAFSDVDYSLTAYRTLVEEHEQRKIQVEASRKALELSMARYNYGYTSYLEVIVQENSLFDAELQESTTLQQKLNAVVLLYKALGGGW